MKCGQYKLTPQSFGSSSQDLLVLFMMIVRTSSVVAGRSTQSGVMLCCCVFICKLGYTIFTNLLYLVLKEI